MNRLLVTTALVLLGWGLVAGAAPPAPQPDDLVLRGYEFAYNLDFPESRKAFEEAIAARPKDTSGYRGLATLTWLQILFNRGVVTVDDYMGQVSRSDVKVDPVPPAEVARFRTNVERALALAEEEVRRNPNSAAAHYDVGASVGLLASYTAVVEGRVMGGLRSARRAYQEQEKVLSLDPRRKDAGLVVGTYRYIVASLPLPVRLLAYVVGFGGGKERGIQMIEEAAVYPGESQYEAKFALALLYNRERRFDRAMRVIEELQGRFPRNRLLWLESGATALRAGRPSVADAELTAGIERLAHDRRPLSFGEEALWRYKRGAARVLLGNIAGAESDLNAVLRLKGREWVTARTHLELGKLSDLRGNRPRAQNEYQMAVGMAGRSKDQPAVDEASALLKTPYRKS